MDWFSGWHWAIVAVVFLVLFGAGRLPKAAQSLGSSMRIFKKSLKEGMTDDEASGGPANVTQGTVLPAAQIPGPSSDEVKQTQIDDLQRQIQELQRASAGGDARPASGQAPGEPSRDAQA